MPTTPRTDAFRAFRYTRTPARTLLVAILATLGSLFMAQSSQAQTSADSTITLEWTATGDDGTIGTASSYDLRYRTTAISGTDTLSWWNAATRVTGLPVPHVAGSTDSMRVRGLAPLTTYYFLVRVADEVPNWSGYSNVVARATSGDQTAPGTIADLAVTGTTGTSASIRWTAPGDDGASGTALSYDIRYSTSAITSSNWGSATPVTGEPTPATAGTQQTFTISGLTASRTYYIAMRATDNSGNVSALSNVPTATTLDTVAPAPVRDLSLNQDSGTADPSAAASVNHEVAVASR